MLLSRPRLTYSIVVLLDAESFGSAEGSLALEESLQRINIPLCRVVCDDGLEQALSNCR